MDIGPGDRVICVDASAHPGQDERQRKMLSQLKRGGIYTVRAVANGGLFLVEAVAAYEHEGEGWRLRRFRKLPDISEWLETSTGYEEPRRVPAPREVEGV